METIIDQLQQSNSIFSTINPMFMLSMTVIFAVLGKIIFSLRRVMDFHSEYFVKKRTKRIAELQPLFKEGRPISQFLDQSLESEAFKISSGITASPAKMNALIEIHDSGHWTISQLRNASRHFVIDPTTQEASFKITTADKVFASASLIFTLLILAIGSGYFVLLAFTKGLSGFTLGAVIFFISTIFSYSIAYDFRAYRAAKKIGAYLKQSHVEEKPPA